MENINTNCRTLESVFLNQFFLLYNCNIIPILMQLGKIRDLCSRENILRLRARRFPYDKYANKVCCKPIPNANVA